MSIEIKKAKDEEKKIKPYNIKIIKNKYIFNMANKKRKKIYTIKNDGENYFINNHNMINIFKNKMKIYNYILFLIYIALYPSTCIS